MPEYSSSQSTKQALIEAAGELFAEHGYAAVTTREIAKSACENIGSIHYHFGSKDGLFEAVLHFATQAWDSNPLDYYYKKNAALLNSKKTIPSFVEGFFDCYYNTLFFREEKPEWCSALIFQTLQRDLPAAKLIYEKVVLPSSNVCLEIYRNATDDAIAANAIAWAITALSPTLLISVDTATVRKLHPDQKISPAFIETVKRANIKAALGGLGLLPS